MPVYDYKCNTCGKTFEYKQSISDSALSNCPAEICTGIEKGRGEVVRVMSKNIGLVFKGSGFYLTDYTKKASSEPTSSSTHGCSSGSCGCSSGNVA
ncbi:hypothetical protein MASR1M45_06120 [Candidatus Kapaibacterium sp.]